MFPRSLYVTTLMAGLVHHLTFHNVERKQTHIDLWENYIMFCISVTLNTVTSDSVLAPLSAMLHNAD